MPFCEWLKADPDIARGPSDWTFTADTFRKAGVGVAAIDGMAARFCLEGQGKPFVRWFNEARPFGPEFAFPDDTPEDRPRP